MKKAFGRNLIVAAFCGQVLGWLWLFFCCIVGFLATEGWAYFSPVGWLFVVLGGLILVQRQKPSFFSGRFVIGLGLLLIFYGVLIGISENERYCFYAFLSIPIWGCSWLLYRIGIDIVKRGL